MKAQIYDLIYIFIEQKTSIDSSYSQIIRVQRNHTPIYHTMDLFIPIQDLNWIAT